MQRLEVSRAVRPIYGSLGIKQLRDMADILTKIDIVGFCISCTEHINTHGS